MDWDVDGLRTGQRPITLSFNSGIEVDGREILLPLPPSENKRLEPRYNSKGFKNTHEYNSWLNYASNRLMAGRYEPFEGKIAACLNVIFPNYIRRDAQNYEKPFFDALTQSECVYSDDSQIYFHSTTTRIIKGKALILAYIFPLESFKSTLGFNEINACDSYVDKLLSTGGVIR